MAPKLTPAADAVGEARETTTACKTIRAQAALKNKALFDVLPPLLLHDDPRASANKLYAGTRTSPVEHAAFQSGSWAGDSGHARRYVGVVLFDLNAHSHLAALYSTTVNAVSTLVVHVYDAPLAELEADLFDSKRKPSMIEDTWLGHDLSKTLRDLRVATGAFVRSQGTSNFPNFLFSDDYHLVRPGLLPLLHLRGFQDDLECERVEQLLLKLVLAESNAPMPSLGVPELELDVDAVITVFDFGAPPESKMAVAPSGVEDAVADVVKACRSTVIHLLVAQVLKTPNVKAWDLAIEMSAESNAKLEGVELMEASEMARTSASYTLSTLTRVVGAHGATGLELLDSTGTIADAMQTVAARLFAASDAVVAARFLDSSTDIATAMYNLGRRVDAPNAMLIVHTDAGHVVKTIQLINNAFDVEITSMDSALRLIFCPWITPTVMHTVEHKKSVYVLTTNSIVRDPFRISDPLRVAHTSAPAPTPDKSNVSSHDFDQFRRDMTQRLDALVGSSAKNATTSMPPPPPPNDSAAVASLRKTTGMLKKLARKRPFQ